MVNGPFIRLIGDVIDRIAQMITVILVMMMISVVGLNVFCRYLLGFSWAWGEEFPRYAMVWIAFIGGSVAVKHTQMMLINYLVEKLPTPVRGYAMVFAHASSCIFLGLSAFYGILLTAATSNQLSPALRFPMSYAYVVIPIGCSVMFFHVFVQLVDLIKGRGVDTP